MMNLLKQDIELLNQKGITEEMLRSQLSFFQKGIPPVVLAAPATTNDGIMVLTDIEKERCVSWFEMKKRNWISLNLYRHPEPLLVCFNRCLLF